MRPLTVLALISICALACDDPKDAKPASAPSAMAPVATNAPALAAAPTASAAPEAASAKKKEWKCTASATADFQGDDALEKEVRLKLQKPKGEIAISELRSIKSLNLTKYGPIDALNPCLMPKFTGLHDLFVGSGALDDLGPIASLTQLVSLRATDNRVSDLRPLSNMVHLDRLDVSRSQVRDLSPVKALVELTELSLDNTSIDDLTATSAFTKLEKVSLANTPVKDLSPLKGAKKLSVIDISGTAVIDTSMLARGVRVKN